MMRSMYFQRNLWKFPTTSKGEFRDQGWFETIEPRTGLRALVCEVQQSDLGRQLFAGLPVVTEAIAGPCNNMCFSSAEKLQPFQRLQKN